MAKALTVPSIQRLKPDIKRRLEIPDGLLPGLYFVVQPTGSKSWAVRYRHGGKPRKLTLGPFPVLDLAAARAHAREALHTVALGRDPGTEKQERRRTAISQDHTEDSVGAIVRLFLERHTKKKNKARSAE